MSDDEDDEILSGRARRSKLAKKGRTKMRTLADSSDEEPEFAYAVAAPPPPPEVDEEDLDYSFSIDNLRRAARQIQGCMKPPTNFSPKIKSWGKVTDQISDEKIVLHDLGKLVEYVNGAEKAEGLSLEFKCLVTDLAHQSCVEAKKKDDTKKAQQIFKAKTKGDKSSHVANLVSCRWLKESFRQVKKLKELKDGDDNMHVTLLKRSFAFMRDAFVIDNEKKLQVLKEKQGIDWVFAAEGITNYARANGLDSLRRASFRASQHFSDLKNGAKGGETNATAADSTGPATATTATGSSPTSSAATAATSNGTSLEDRARKKREERMQSLRRKAHGAMGMVGAASDPQRGTSTGPAVVSNTAMERRGSGTSPPAGRTSTFSSLVSTVSASGSPNEGNDSKVATWGRPSSSTENSGRDGSRSSNSWGTGRSESSSANDKPAENTRGNGWGRSSGSWGSGKPAADSAPDSSGSNSGGSRSSNKWGVPYTAASSRDDQAGSAGGNTSNAWGGSTSSTSGTAKETNSWGGGTSNSSRGERHENGSTNSGSRNWGQADPARSESHPSPPPVSSWGNAQSSAPAPVPSPAPSNQGWGNSSGRNPDSDGRSRDEPDNRPNQWGTAPRNDNSDSGPDRWGEPSRRGSSNNWGGSGPRDAPSSSHPNSGPDESGSSRGWGSPPAREQSYESSRSHDNAAADTSSRDWGGASSNSGGAWGNEPPRRQSGWGNDPGSDTAGPGSSRTNQPPSMNVESGSAEANERGWGRDAPRASGNAAGSVHDNQTTGGRDGWGRSSREPDNYSYGEQGQKRGADEEDNRRWNGNKRSRQSSQSGSQSFSGRGGDDGASGRGRGRGRTLPAWMTQNSNSDGPQGGGNPSPAPREDSGPPPHRNAHQGGYSDRRGGVSSEPPRRMSGTGRGRGRTLPAWMTQQEQDEGARGRGPGPGPDRMDREDPSHHQQGFRSNEPPVDRSIQYQGSGRGRGRTLPAWMTNK